MIEFKRRSIPGDFPVFWRGEAKMLPGGFKPIQTFPQGTVIYRGAYAEVNFDNMTVAIVKIAKVLNGGTTTKPRVQKGHYLLPGDIVMRLGTTDKSSAVKTIDRTNSAYDVIELTEAIPSLAEGDFLQESTEYVDAVKGDDGKVEKEAIPASPKYLPNMVVGATREFGKGIITLDLAYDTVVLKEAVYPFPAEWLGFHSPCLKYNPKIIFIKQ